MAKKRATITDLLNDLTFKVIFDKFHLLAVNAHEWEGLPDDIDEKYIEEFLFDFGKSIFFKDPKKSYMALQAQNGYGLNVYGQPTTYRAIGFGYNKEYDAEKCVIIQNNKLRLPTRPFIYFYVNKIVEAERTADVNIKAVKTPVVFACDDKDVLTFKNLFQKVDGNTPAIFADKGLNLDAIQAFQTGAKFLGNDLNDYINTVENKLLTFLGFNNLPTDKKERQIVDEVNVNNQLIDNFARLQLIARQEACEQINKMFGLNVTVRRRDLTEIMEMEGSEPNVENDNVRYDETNR